VDKVEAEMSQQKICSPIPTPIPQKLASCMQPTLDHSFSIPLLKESFGFIKLWRLL
jgi:hypothetical protein